MEAYMANSRTNPTAFTRRRITKTALRRVYAQAEPLTQLDLFIDKEGIARNALRQLRDVDRMAEEAGIKLRPLIRKRT
jgi:hypothetical protein